MASGYGFGVRHQDHLPQHLVTVWAGAYCGSRAERPKNAGRWSPGFEPGD